MNDNKFFAFSEVCLVDNNKNGHVFDKKLFITFLEAESAVGEIRALQLCRQPRLPSPASDSDLKSKQRWGKTSCAMAAFWRFALATRISPDCMLKRRFGAKGRAFDG